MKISKVQLKNQLRTIVKEALLMEEFPPLLTGLKKYTRDQLSSKFSIGPNSKQIEIPVTKSTKAPYSNGIVVWLDAQNQIIAISIGAKDLQVISPYHTYSERQPRDFYKFTKEEQKRWYDREKFSITNRKAAVDAATKAFFIEPDPTSKDLHFSRQAAHDKLRQTSEKDPLDVKDGENKDNNVRALAYLESKESHLRQHLRKITNNILKDVVTAVENGDSKILRQLSQVVNISEEDSKAISDINELLSKLDGKYIHMHSWGKDRDEELKKFIAKINKYAH